MEKTVVFIPVRGGSRSIPLKNIKEFCGQPLVYWTTKAASDCRLVDAVYVATDSEQIRKVVEDLHYQKFRSLSAVQIQLQIQLLRRRRWWNLRRHIDVRI